MIKFFSSVCAKKNVKKINFWSIIVDLSKYGYTQKEAIKLFKKRIEEEKE